MARLPECLGAQMPQYLPQLMQRKRRGRDDERIFLCEILFGEPELAVGSREQLGQRFRASARHTHGADQAGSAWAHDADRSSAARLRL